MKIENLVAPKDICAKLLKHGFYKQSLFSYFRDPFGDLKVINSDIGCEWEYVAPAYLFEELYGVFPESLSVDENTYIPDSSFGGDWRKVGEFEPGEVPECRLEFFKSGGVSESHMVMRYAYNGKMVAFRTNSQGQYCNLLTFGDTPAECAAKMVLTLFEEQILQSEVKVN